MNLTDPDEIENHYSAEIEAGRGLNLGPEPDAPEEIDDYTMVPYAKAFAIWAHGAQLYGVHPYATHLREVVGILDDHGFDVHYHPLVVITGWCHDVLEDTHITRAGFASRFGDEAERMVWACTGVGKNRKEKQAAIKAKLLNCPEAQPAKAADRLANMRSSLRDNIRGLVSMYSGEFGDFMSSVPHIPDSLRQALREVQAQCLEYLKA